MSSLTCQNCGAQLPANARFCLECGREVTAVASLENQDKKSKKTARDRKVFRPPSWKLRIVGYIGYTFVFILALIIKDSFFGWVFAIAGAVEAATGIVASAIAKKQLKQWFPELGAGIVLLSMAAVLAWVIPSGVIPTGVTSPTPTFNIVETIEQTLERGTAITSVKFDLVTNIPGIPESVEKMWVKGNKITIESGLVVVIQDGDAKTQYTYLPQLNMAVKTDLTAESEGLELFSPAEVAKSMLEQHPSVTGSKTIDGKDSFIIKATTEDGQEYTAGIWKQYGIPIEVEMATSEGKIKMEYKNIDFSYIPDGLFRLPAGVQIVDETTFGTVLGQTQPSGTGLPPSPMPSSNRYVNTAWGYSIQIPDGWTVDDADRSDLTLSSWSETGSWIGRVQVWANIRDWDTLESYVDSKVSYLRSNYPDYREFSRTKFMLPGDLPAYALVYRLTTPPDTAPGRGLGVLTIKGNRQIQVLASTWDRNWDLYHSQLEEIAYSLVVE